MTSDIRDSYRETTGEFYVVTNSSKTKVFGNCFGFEYAHMFAADVSTILTFKAIGTKKTDPKVLLLIHEQVNDGTWRFRKIATYQNGDMVACDHRRKEFLNGEI